MKRIVHAIAILVFVFIAGFIIHFFWEAGGHPLYFYQHKSDESVEQQGGAPKAGSKSWFCFPFFSKKTKPVAEEKERKDHFLIPKRVSFRYVQGVGSDLHDVREATAYGTDYAAVAALFTSKYHPGRIFPMLDIRAEGFINNTYACNIGVGGRYVPTADYFCSLLGFNAYYDFRGGFNGTYHQLGLGMELLGKRWDFRANGYIPLGAKSHTSANCPFNSDGNIIHSKEYKSMPFAFNFELGYLAIKSEDFLLYTAGGPYFFAKKHLKHSAGGEVRIRPQYKDYVALDLSVRYDSVFHTVFQAELILYWPLYKLSSEKNKKPTCGLTERQIYQPVERFEVMSLYRRRCP